MGRRKDNSVDAAVAMVSDGSDPFIVRDGVKIAKRGHPGTKHAKTWIPLEPGWAVRDVGARGLIVTFQGVPVQ